MCFDYIGGVRTRFTERILYYDNIHTKNRKLDFPSFALIVWNYCTLTSAALARMIFEIFDPERNGTLEMVDIKTIYQMLYDSSDFDEKEIARLPFDKFNRISKARFIGHCKNHHHIIQPMIDYQSIMRRRLGGILMYVSMTVPVFESIIIL